MKSKTCPDVSVHLDNSIGGGITQEAYLTNSNNKECLIELLATALSSNGHGVVRCRGDAATSIVSTVLDYAACERTFSWLQLIQIFFTCGTT